MEDGYEEENPTEHREAGRPLGVRGGRPIADVATDLDVHKEALRTWVRQAERTPAARRADERPA